MSTRHDSCIRAPDTRVGSQNRRTPRSPVAPSGLRPGAGYATGEKAATGELSPGERVPSSLLSRLGPPGLQSLPMIERFGCSGGPQSPEVESCSCKKTAGTCRPMTAGAPQSGPHPSYSRVSFRMPRRSCRACSEGLIRTGRASSCNVFAPAALRRMVCPPAPSRGERPSTRRIFFELPPGQSVPLWQLGECCCDTAKRGVAVSLTASTSRWTGARSVAPNPHAGAPPTHSSNRAPTVPAGSHFSDSCVCRLPPLVSHRASEERLQIPEGTRPGA